MPITDDIVARANDDLQRAISTAARARELLEKAEQDVADLTTFLRTLDRYVAPTVSEGIGGAKGEHGKNRRQSLAPVGTRGRDMADIAIATIRAAGTPVKIGDLLDAVNQAGFTLGGSDHKSNLAGYLSRDPRLASRGRGIGWVVLEDEEAAPEPASGETASSTNQGGTDDRSTLASSAYDDLLGSSQARVP